jgi:hypothetical protein
MNTHGKTVFTVSADSIKVVPVPGGGFRYRIDGHTSYSRYHNEASARHDARRAQVLHDDGKIEPVESAQKYERL